jgi:ribonuclease D
MTFVAVVSVLHFAGWDLQCFVSEQTTNTTAVSDNVSLLTKELP